MKGHCTILDISYRKNTRKRDIAELLMIKVIRPSLNEKEKSVEFFTKISIQGLYQKHCTVCRTCANLTTVILQFALQRYLCIVVMKMSFLIFIILLQFPLGKLACTNSLMRFNNCIFCMLFYSIADCEKVFNNVLKF